MRENGGTDRRHRLRQALWSAGPGATAFLDWFTCNRLPKVGRINLTYALTDAGTTRTEYTIVRDGEDDYYLVSAGAWTAYDADFLRKAAEDMGGPSSAGSTCHDVTTQWGVFALAGPNARATPARRSIHDAEPATALGNKRFPWLSARDIELGMCPVDGDPRGLYRRARLGAAPPDRDAELPVRPADGGGRAAWAEARRRPRAELAAAGEELPRLRHRAWPRRDPAGGRT